MKDDDSQNAGDGQDGDDPDRKKQKRRSKNDVQGRDHKCNYCDKTYLSYPALYTHMKNKHAKGPDGQPLISINSGRGRGRPKKNALGVRFSHVDPTSDEFFKTNDKIGGPIEPTIGFKEVYTEIYIKRAKQPEKKMDDLTANVGEGNDQTENKNDENTVMANGEDDNDANNEGEKEGENEDQKTRANQLD